ncbi:unnamed protein product [Mytilus coruscus]|uniref:Uncharacterized protein n=1 Tax=Mytilus coruscus TaxID=42192 RepID=A0A6J8AJ98_MYTCO|nr:unnamed protein product [Mytilus coruscus]
MMTKFVRGSALTDGRPQVFRRYKTFMPEKRISPLKMTPDKYTYPFLQGKSKEIAKEQLSRLHDISVEKGNSIEITQSIPGPSTCTSDKIELNKRKRELFTKSAKGKAARTTMNTKASGPKRKTASKGKVPLKTQVPDTPTPSQMEEKEPENEDLVLLDLGEATGLLEEDGHFIALDNSTISLDSNAIIDIAENWENGNIPHLEELEDMVDMIVEIINQDLVVQFKKGFRN